MTSIQNMAKHGSEGGIRSDQSISFNESNVFSLTYAEENISTFNTISSYSEDVTVGLGTKTPSCRLSFGKNTSNVFNDEIEKNSLPAICFNEETNGTDTT